MRKLLLGDWTPVIRDPLDVERLTFVVGVVHTPAPRCSAPVA